MVRRIVAGFALGCLFAGILRVGLAAAADATVAPNGDGQFKSIQDAIMAAPQGLPSATRPWIIHVKPGIYSELIYVQHERRFIWDVELGEFRPRMQVSGCRVAG